MKFFRKKATRPCAARDSIDRTEERLDAVRNLAMGLTGRICL